MRMCYAEGIHLMPSWDIDDPVVQKLSGQIITRIDVKDDYVRMDVGHYEVELRDVDQQCCEHRYMNTDDDFPGFLGSRLCGIKVVDGPTEQLHDEGGWKGDEVQSQFLRIETDRGDFVVTCYNKHNGYYEGFDLRVFFK